METERRDEMIPKNLTKARILAEKVFQASTGVEVLTIKGERYKHPPTSRWLMCIDKKLSLHYRIPWKPKEKDRDYREQYIPLCKVTKYSTKGLDVKPWYVLIDAIMEHLDKDPIEG